jgi:hypothetical protein
MSFGRQIKTDESYTHPTEVLTASEAFCRKFGKEKKIVPESGCSEASGCLPPQKKLDTYH